uniref:Uncharacterized protein n=1 Tax=Anguilla anguilla TaxID=7936 RepID=A0A0E9RAJ3_ANGAN
MMRSNQHGPKSPEECFSTSFNPCRKKKKN